MAFHSRKHCTGQIINFASTEFEICYIFSIDTENEGFCQILGARCVAIGFYVMLEGHRSCRMLFLKPNSLETFGHTTNRTIRLIFLHSKCCLPRCLRIKAFGNLVGFFPGLICYKNLLFKKGFFQNFLFLGLIWYKSSKTPKMLIYVYLTISMSSSIMCRSRNG